MLVDSVRIDPNSLGRFRICASPRIVADHQRLDDTSYVFTAAVPTPLAVSASEQIHILQHTSSVLSALQKNVRATFDRIDTFTTIPSHAASPIIRIHIRRLSGTVKAPNLVISTSHDAPSLDVAGTCR